MDLSRVDILMYIYNAAAVLSGAYIVIYFGIEDNIAVLAAALFLAVLWTIYFRYNIRPRFADIEEREARNADSEPG